MNEVIIFLPLFMSMLTFGLYHSGDEEMILEKRRKNLQSKVDRGFFPAFVAKPTFLCSPCMNSIWGSLLYWCVMVFLVWPGLKIALIFWPFAVVIAVGISIFLESIYSSLKKRPENGNPGAAPFIHNRPGPGTGTQ
jgi:hypothetical protein